ncbi:peptide chain release factor 1 [Acidobacteria bacterium Mor1]|nr:peptide chain release factor 1 [Acidobacteria bacterium Mor1]
MLEKLEGLEKRFEELNESMADPEVVADREKYKEVTKTYTELKPIVENYREFRAATEELEGSRELLNSGDPEMAEMAGEEVTRLEGRLEELEQELKVLLLPTDPNDARNVVLEIRAGTGGDEATLFAAEMFRMYSRFAESTGWKVETMDVSESAAGGVKEVVAMIEGDRVFSRLKFESGVHRVQRVPETEAQGRVHTSAVTVAVLPEADDVEVEIDEKDIRLDTFCSSGPGGQSVNTTQSAVRITHLPTGLVVQCQDEKSWHKNKAQAMKVLRSRLYDKMVQEQHDEIAKERSSLIGSGDRSEKIRTYNFPQNRVTDHRIKLTVHNLTQVMEGELGNIVEALVSQDRADRLRAEM